MAGFFAQLGMISTGGMGVEPLAWQEIESFDRAQRCRLSAWESSTLMAMSRAYCAGNNLGRNQDKVPDEVPYIEDTEATREAMRDYVLRRRKEEHRKLDDTLDGAI